jgi:mRNA interferase YafQ
MTKLLESMRTIKSTTQFKRDYKREKRGRYRTTIDNELSMIVRLLIMDTKLPELMHDHSLTGNLKDCRDCHIKPDLVLVYRKTDDNTLELVRLGSHSELGF